MKRILPSLFPVLLFSSACNQALLPERSGLTLEEESGEALESVPRVARFRLLGAGAIALEDIWLVSGDVSSVSQGKLERGEVPKTVEDHREPLIVWVEGEEIRLAPSTILEAGARYSLVAVGAGLIGTFAVSSEERPVLRLWGSSFAPAGGEAVYCTGAPPHLSTPLDLDAFDQAPGFQRGVSVTGIGADYCVRAALPTDEDIFLPPASVDEFLLEPTPIDLLPDVVPVDGTGSPSGCEGSVQFHGGCAVVMQGAVMARVSAGYYFFSFAKKGTKESTHEVVLEALTDQSIAFGPLEADSLYELSITRFSPGASSVEGENEVHTFESGPPAARFILTEVLADPLGSEPQAEWVEVMNAGTSAGSLGGLFLWDSGRGVPLPDVVLGPGEVGLIVRSDFSFSSDVIPDAASVPVVVPTLGDNGLRNSGEEVSLRSEDGQILSSIPAIPARAGESVARRDPWATDARDSFEVTSPPSPGVF